MFDDTTEAGMLCRCGHPALTHLHADDDERCEMPDCGCVEFVRPDDLPQTRVEPSAV